MALIYVSSTYKDLVEYRSAVAATLRQLGHQAIAMEDYVAADNRPLDVCLNDVARCDAYVGLFARGATDSCLKKRIPIRALRDRV